jgi:endonuclease III
MAKGKNISAADLEIDLRSMKEEEFFKWLLACLLFGKPIQRTVAVRAYNEFVKEGLLSPKAILDVGWDKLVEILDRGHYVRFDYSTADKLLEVSTKLVEDYGGDVLNIIRNAKDTKDLSGRLDSLPGVGPTTVRIFLEGMEQEGVLPLNPVE